MISDALLGAKNAEIKLVHDRHDYEYLVRDFFTAGGIRIKRYYFHPGAPRGSDQFAPLNAY